MDVLLYGSGFLRRHPDGRMEHIPVDQVTISTAPPPAGTSADAQRYYKLRKWLGSNVPEGWRKVDHLAAVACYADWDEFDKYLDSMPEYNVGLCEVATPIASALPAAQPTVTETTMPNIEILESAADATMNPEERDLFDKFDADTKQRFLNQILKRAVEHAKENGK
jgi:hypothetical protein